MSDVGSFAAFQRSLAAAPTAAAAQDLFETTSAECRAWPPERCAKWIGELAPWLESGGLQDIEALKDRWGFGVDHPPSGHDVYDSGCDLAEALLQRLDELHATVPFDRIEMFVRDCAGIPRTFPLPRRDLIPAYQRWIEEVSVPAVLGYREQVARSATPQERIRIAEIIQAADQEVAEYVGGGWIATAIPDLMRIRPEDVREWVDLLREVWGPTRDPMQDAQLGSFERWLRNVGSEALPQEIDGYLLGSEFGGEANAQAARALEQSDAPAWSLNREAVSRLLERDRLLESPPLPDSVGSHACQTAKAWITSLFRLEATGGVQPAVSCACLAFAIEAQVRHALTRRLPSWAIGEVGGLGLTGLARILRVSAEARPGWMDLAPMQDAQLPELLARAGKIRDKVHHPSPAKRLSRADADDLRRIALVDDPSGDGLFQRINRIQCRCRSG